jgi:hypothetical protein
MRRLTFALLLAVLLSGPAAAEPPNPEPSWFAEVESAAGWLRRTAGRAVTWVGRIVEPATPEIIARRIERKDSELWALLEDAGYRLARVETGSGLIPSAKATFTLERELSAVDREQLEERLEQYAARDGGLAARLNRWIVSVLLDASENRAHRIDTVDIWFWPLPRAEFSLSTQAAR